VVLDFGENIKRHGAIDSKDYGKRSRRKGTGGGDGPTKTCPSCAELVPAGARECSCGFRFPPPETTHDATADKDSAILETQQSPQQWIVEGISYTEHIKKDTGARSMRVNYEVTPDNDEEGNLRTQVISEWVCFEHIGYAQRMAERWWAKRSGEPIPREVPDAIEICRSGAIADTRAITTVKEGRFYRIRDYVLGEIPDETFEPVDDFEEAPF
jgi:DNA repair protein RadD